MNETTITIVGNLVDDPEMRYTPQGQPVARFRIAATPVPGQHIGTVEGRRDAVPDVQPLAAARRERR